jgi:fructose-bisphosphate aldolase class II
VPKKVDSFIRPLIEATAELRSAGQNNLFNSHMFDGSELPTDENMKLSVELLKFCKENQIILEVEIGVVGGEEDGVDHSNVGKEKLYTTPEDMLKVYEALNPIGGRYMVAATFGNVHGIYKPGNVVLKPKILAEGQKVLKETFGDKADFDLVFHGGSGSELTDIHETINYGVVKMNVDTDTQYHFTQPIKTHMIDNADELTHTADKMANKKKFDPRSYLKKGEESMAARIGQACKDLRSDGKSIFGK